MERQQQRLKAYTFAQWRLREQLASGSDGPQALMGVVGEARALFHLTSEEWHALTNALASAVHSDMDEL
jgi:hypothetical protein